MEYTYRVDTSGADVTLTLPAATGSGRKYNVKLWVAGNDCLVDPDGTDEIDNLGAANLTNHQSIRAHPQRLTDQIAQGDRPGTLNVRWAGLESDHMRMLRMQLRQRPLPDLADAARGADCVDDVGVGHVSLPVCLSFCSGLLRHCRSGRQSQGRQACARPAVADAAQLVPRGGTADCQGSGASA